MFFVPFVEVEDKTEEGLHTSTFVLWSKRQNARSQLFFQETLPTFFIYSFGGCLGTVFENFKLFCYNVRKS